jgi:hypothetical protein
MFNAANSDLLGTFAIVKFGQSIAWQSFDRHDRLTLRLGGPYGCQSAAHTNPDARH